jgi:CubicO group peptidase (beta-lactamase class C family)
VLPAANGLATGAAWLYSPWMLPWSEAIDPVADQNGFAGVVSVHRGGETEFAQACGLADRARQIPNTVRTRFAIASGTKGLTALAVVSLINDNALAMSTTARSVLGADLPLIGDDVTIEHLLAHRSGIGDYLDEEAGYDVTGYPLTVPPQDLATTGQYLAELGGHPPSSPLASGSPIATAGTSCSR